MYLCACWQPNSQRCFKNDWSSCVPPAQQSQRQPDRQVASSFAARNATGQENHLAKGDHRWAAVRGLWLDVNWSGDSSSLINAFDSPNQQVSASARSAPTALATLFFQQIRTIILSYTWQHTPTQQHEYVCMCSLARPEAKGLIAHIHYHSVLLQKHIFVFCIFSIFNSFIALFKPAVALQVFMVYYDSTLPCCAWLPIGKFCQWASFANGQSYCSKPLAASSQLAGLMRHSSGIFPCAAVF